MHAPRLFEIVNTDSLLGEALGWRPVVLMADVILKTPALKAKFEPRAEGGLWVVPDFGIDAKTSGWTDGYAQRKTAGFSNPANKQNHNPDAVSKRLAERIWEISGAELSWLIGKSPADAFDYGHLIKWYPGKFPESAKEIEALQSYRSTDFIHALNYVFDPIGRDRFRLEGNPSLPAAILRIMADSFKESRSTPTRMPIWMSFAFAPNQIAIKTALGWGVLDEVPEIDLESYRKILEGVQLTSKPDKNWSDLIHEITKLCGKELRKSA